ncbi:phytanoyl-CoA dioxygenase family protein [Catenovulum sediminis]|uniref:Phytanoyl-CoA dioxygenase family protein n=1 Tax=Catenovulum sediminis TaxID=1740262 RepID=A0ABV1RMC5_9ALTE|nr:phytanoyl-CoA dioxygenase family protein [Catenovulum sediminis]
MEQISQYRSQGYAFHRQAFNQQEVKEIKQKIMLYGQAYDNPGIVKENDGQTLRGLHGAHLYDTFFAELVKDPRFIVLAQELIAEPFYIHQFKINVKSKMKGASWPWHQDFVFWQNEDGIAQSNMVNIALLLSDVEILHGPLCVIPNSHKNGNLCQKINRKDNWMSDVSSDLSYQLDEYTVAELIDTHGTQYITGKAGDIFLFDPQLAHCSSSNLSPFNRELMIITYNPCTNQPQIAAEEGRPEFLCGRDFNPLVELANNLAKS